MIRLIKIGIKFVEKEYFDKFVLEDLYYWGKFIVKGIFFDEYLEFIDSVVYIYRNNLKYIEDFFIDYFLWDWEKKILFVYEFKKEIFDLDFFVKVIIIFKELFRIWGFVK